MWLCFICSHFLREEDDHKHRVLLIQCERGDKHQQLLQCAQYKLQKVWSDIAKPKHHAVFIVQLPRVTSAAFSGFLVRALIMCYVYNWLRRRHSRILKHFMFCVVLAPVRT